MAGKRKPIRNRILWNRRPESMRDGGDIDEIVITEPSVVHIEQMTDRCWWIGITMPDNSEWTGNFTCDSRGRMGFMQQDNDGIEWDDDDEHKAAI